MTAQTTTVNKAAFEQGDRPQGSNYADLIDSFINIVDTTAQSIASNLTIPNLRVNTELTISLVSAQSIAASSATIGTLSGTTAKFSVCSAPSLRANAFLTTSINVNNGNAFMRSNGTVDCIRMNMTSVDATALTSAQVSACGLSGAIAALWVVRMEINGSVIAVPCFRSGAHWF